VAAFFSGLGMKILDVYGMTETTGAFTANTPDEFKLGTVGRRVAGMEVKIADDGEILTRGPLTTPGYHGRPDLTAALIDGDGWLHTGDIGTIDADGFVSVTDRKKELIITAGGENIAPAAVENLLVAHPLIGQALAYGDGKPYLVALLTLDGEAAPTWARARGIPAGGVRPAGTDRSGGLYSRRQRTAGPGAAGEAMAPAARGMDSRDRGTDPHAQAQAPRRARQVRRRHRIPVSRVRHPDSISGFRKAR
jgi:acyl-CoA synthetase (AMP-forming)/AMP-acid ligase II